MKSLILHLLFSLLAVSIFHIAAVNAEIGKSNQGRIKVGFIVPLSGDAASIGKAVQNGVEIALEKLAPQQREQLELFWEDDALRPAQTVSAFNKLTSINKVDVVLNTTSGTAHAIAGLAEKAEVPLIAVASDPKIVLNRKWVVNFWVTPEEEARVFIPEALRRGHKKVARLSTLHEGAFAVRSAIDKVNDGKIEWVLDEDFGPDVRDFRTYIAKLRTHSDVDGLLPILLPGQLGNFAKQVRAAGVQLPFIGIEFFEDRNEVKASDGALVGSWYVNTADVDDDFVKEYFSRFPGDSIWGASSGHDAILLLAEAASLGAERSRINDFLHTVKNFSGAQGVFSATGDNRFSLPAAVKIVTADGFVQVKSEL